MAKWIISRRGAGQLMLTYRDSATGESFSCGELRPDTPHDLIVEWIVQQGPALPGDLILWPDGALNLVSLSTGSA